MTFWKLFKKKHKILLIAFLLINGAYSAHAYVASSTNYRIQSDSINVGGLRQTSTNYISEDTIGELATGFSESALYKLKAGYQQMQETYIAISPCDDITLTPPIPGVSGGTSDGLTIGTTTTDNPAGYSLSIKASTTPALQFGSYVFDDYDTGIADATTSPTYDWSIANSSSEFGFTPEGNHIVQKFKDNGSNLCDIGSNETTDKCWHNLSTSEENIAQSTSPNHPSGTATTIKFRAQSGVNHVQEEGTYTAKISVTAVTL